MKLSTIIKNIQDSTSELKRAKSDNNSTIINKISAFSKEDAEIMRFLTKQEFDNLSEEEKNKYKEQEPIKELLIKKYNLISRLDKGIDNFIGR